MCGTHEWKTQCRKSLNPILNPIKFNHPIHSFMVYIKNFMHVLYEDHSFSIAGADLGFFVPKSKFATSTMTSQAMTSFDDKMTVDFRGYISN